MRYKLGAPTSKKKSLKSLSYCVLTILISISNCKPQLEKSVLDYLPLEKLFKMSTGTGVGQSEFTFSYPQSDYSLLVKEPLSSPIKPNSSKTIQACQSSPQLPSGLRLENDCSISGTPDQVTSANFFTITANTGSEKKVFSLRITIRPSQTVTLTYFSTSFSFSTGVAISPISPIVSAPMDSCISEPLLPSGLTLNSACNISGTPTNTQFPTIYKITGTNSSGSASISISITIISNAPSSLSYSGSPYIFTQNSPIASVIPTYSGTISSCSSSPTLPIGLSLSSSCTISGTPTTLSVATNYSITASNAYGSTSSTILITIDTVPPSGLSYSGSPFVFTQNVLITTQVPAYSGSITSCSSSPVLPAGLSLNNSDCSISGTPTGIQGSTAYTITATNAFGSTTANIAITINIAPPTGLTYTGSPYTFTQNTAITALTPTFSGTLTSCTSSPVLPAGLSINNITCVISGTPTNVQTATTHTITAANASGNTTASISITVNVAAPSSLVYSGSPFTFTQSIAITNQTPTFTGSVTSCSSSPALPAGLGINNTTCVISGTPTATQGSTPYTITASNVSGSTTASISIIVNIAPPSSLVYSGTPFAFTQNIAISTITPTFSGSVTSCTASPALPTGMGINNTTCAITGTPTNLQGNIGYTITASNASGNTTASIAIAVLIPPPSALTYTGSPYEYPIGYAIASSVPTFIGTVTSCTSSPALPTGLSLHNTTCTISGNPSVLSSLTTYTITASNSSGNTTQTVQIEVAKSGYIYYSLFGSANNGGSRRKNAITFTDLSDTLFNPIGSSYAMALDTQRDILYIGYTGTGNNFIHVYDNASTNVGTSNRVITITEMIRVAGLQIDITNNILYAANMDTTAAATTNRFIFRIPSASTKTGTLTAGVDYAKINSTALHDAAASQSLRRMVLDTSRDILYICDYGKKKVFSYDGISAAIHNSTLEPVRTINFTLEACAGLAVDMTRNILYLSAFNTNNILVFDSASTKTGTDVSNRQFTPSSNLTAPAGIFYVSSKNRLYASAYTSGTITYYNNPDTITGAVIPVYSITGITNPVDVQVDLTR